MIKFWYRQSPEYLNTNSFLGGGGRVTGTDPPVNRSGMAEVILDAHGKLHSLVVVPPQIEEPDSESPDPDWSKLFGHAGLDLSLFKPAEPAWAPSVWADTRASWTGADPTNPDISLRIEAASCNGNPVYFHRIEPWTRPSRMGSKAATAGQTVASTILLGLFVTILIGSMLVARRNLQLGRGDRNGASRVAMFVLISSMLSWLFRGHHVPAFFEVGLFVIAAGWSLFSAAVVWLVYMALEPYLRKHWPHAMISWNRVLAGRFRDPLVGRDLMVGTMVGALVVTAIHLRYLGVTWFGEPVPQPPFVSLAALESIGQNIAKILGVLSFTVFLPLGLVFLLFVLRVVLRRNWLAAVFFVLIFLAGSTVRSEDPVMGGILTILMNVLVVIVLHRFGVLPLVAMVFVIQLIRDMPCTLDFNAWHFRSSLIPLGVIVALAIYGFNTALAGRRIFKDTLEEA